jgi:predicted transcriptional regulator
LTQYANIISIGLAHPSVKQVIEIAEEILNEKKILNIDSLYYRAKKVLKIPRKGLKSIIQLLINNKILVNRSKFTKRTVLSNTTRQIIYNFIQSNIGSHFSLIKKSSISKDLGDSPGILIWHLDMLMKFNYIRKLKLKNYTIFIPYEIDDETGKIYFLLQEELYRKLITHFLSIGSQERSQIYKSLGENRGTIYYRIQNLIEFQILDLLDEKIVKINPKKRDLIIKVLGEISNIRELEYFNHS